MTTTLSQTTAVIADIHGNADALAAVLDDIRARGITRIVNLGDHLSGPLAPAETLALLQATPMVSVRGNHDRHLLTQDPGDMIPSDRIAHEEIGAGGLAWLSELPETLDLGEMFLCHATPTQDDRYWVERVTPQGEVVLRPVDEIAREAQGVTAPILLCGHSHQPRLLTLPSGQILVNPGSVGCPAYDDEEPVPHSMQTGSPHARYAILHPGDAAPSVEFVALPYDTARMVARARLHARPVWVEAIATGRVPRA